MQIRTLPVRHLRETHGGTTENRFGDHTTKTLVFILLFLVLYFHFPHKQIYEERMISLEKHYKRCMKLQRQLLNKAMQRSSHTSSSSVSSSYSSALSSFNLRRSSQHHSQGSGSPDVPEDGQGQARDNANGGITRAALRAMSENPSPGESREPSVAEWRATTSPDTADPPVSESI